MKEQLIEIPKEQPQVQEKVVDDHYEIMICCQKYAKREEIRDNAKNMIGRKVRCPKCRHDIFLSQLERYLGEKFCIRCFKPDSQFRLECGHSICLKCYEELIIKGWVTIYELTNKQEIFCNFCRSISKLLNLYIK